MKTLAEHQPLDSFRNICHLQVVLAKARGESAVKAFFRTSHDGSCPPPPLQIVSPPPLQENGRCPLLARLPKGKQELLCFRELIGEPVETFVQTLSLCCTSRLDIPPSVSQLVQAQFFSEFCCRHGIRQVLLVGKEQ